MYLGTCLFVFLSMLLLVESLILNTKWSLIEMLLFIPHALETFWTFVLSRGSSKFISWSELITPCEAGKR